MYVRCNAKVQFGMHKLCNPLRPLNILFDIIKFYLEIRTGCVWNELIWILSRSGKFPLNMGKNNSTVYNKQICYMQSITDPLNGESGVFCMMSILGT